MSAYPPIGSLIPHQPPMRLVDAVLEHEGLRVVCQTTIREDMPFVHGGKVPVLLAIELFAQSAASLMALVAGRATGQPDGVPMGGGAILGSRRIQLHGADLHVGDVLEIRCEERMAIGMAAQIECSMHRDGTLLAEGSINVMAGMPGGAS